MTAVLGPRCDVCKVPMASHDQVEKRVEYRSVQGQRRLRTWRVALVCRRCASCDWDRHDFPNGRPDTRQGVLL